MFERLVSSAFPESTELKCRLSLMISLQLWVMTSDACSALKIVEEQRDDWRPFIIIIITDDRQAAKALASR